MSGPAPVVRLHLFFATENDRAVILRQGPSKQWRMILWHRDTDRFEDGQWLKQKVWPGRCALSPDGANFIYFALDGHWKGPAEGAYSALSQPPYWTALSLFPCGDTWGGGGFFLDNRHYFATGGADIIGRDAGLSRVRPGAPEKGCSSGIRLMSGARAPLDRAATRRILADPAPEGLKDIHDRMPAPQSDAGEQYETQGSALFRRQDVDLVLIRDFGDMTFEPVRAPYDWRDNDASWHPLREDRL
ncbi:hypothetical protein [Roseobacter sp. S98]|uniref:hypothetical protein n=1 Tax=Roseobacter algicola (ex Choi et al. 2025) (nom. illeg.) TaxID=3092138 RepID=UPI0035C68F12